MPIANFGCSTGSTSRPSQPALRACFTAERRLPLPRLEQNRVHQRRRRLHLRRPLHEAHRRPESSTNSRQRAHSCQVQLDSRASRPPTACRPRNRRAGLPGQRTSYHHLLPAQDSRQLGPSPVQPRLHRALRHVSKPGRSRDTPSLRDPAGSRSPAIPATASPALPAIPRSLPAPPASRRSAPSRAVRSSITGNWSSIESVARSIFVRR